MYVNQMMNLLGLRINDPEKKKCPEEFRLQAMNNGQDLAASLLHPALLVNNLSAIEEEFTITGGLSAELTAANLSSGRSILGGETGVLAVQDYNTSTWLLKSVPSAAQLWKIKATENQYLQGTLNNPLYHVFANKLRIMPTAVTSVNLYYLRTPAPLFHIWTATQTGTTTTLYCNDSDLSSSNDYYNGVVLYCITQGTYHVVTDYNGSSKYFTVSPAAPANFALNQTFYMVSHGFDTLALDGVTPELPTETHEIIVTFAQSECLSRMEQDNEAIKAYDKAVEKIAVLNSKVNPDGVIGQLQESAA